MENWPDLQKACFFLGYPRSGHTLIGALLDAHPHICMSHQQDILGRLLRKELTDKEVMIEEIISNTRNQVLTGRMNAGYHYSVPNQWQGKYSKLKIIGDKSGSRSSALLPQYLNAIPKLQKQLQLKLYFIHVIRNPFDAISTSVNRTLARRPKAILEEIYAIKSRNFFRRAQVIEQFQKLTDFPLFNLDFEAFVQNPKNLLTQLLHWLQLEVSEEYITDCTSIVFSKARQPHLDTKWWQDDWVEEIEQQLSIIPFLQHYRF